MDVTSTVLCKKGVREQRKMKSYKMAITLELHPRALKELGGATAK